jgi:hypothetical protein
MRLMYSGRDFVFLYERCDQVSFVDGHVRAFEYFGSVPRRLVYDNLKSAVKRRVGVFRELTDRFQALASHYCFEPCFARPGEGHDKGGVESRGKAIRLQHLTPIPNGSSLAELSVALQEQIDRQAPTKVNEEGKSVAQRFAEERPLMLALPPTVYEARRVASVSVSRKATVRIEGVSYSVPTRWAGLSSMAYIGVDDIRLVCRFALSGQIETVSHRRAPKGSRPQILYRHYLRELARKPQAVRQVAPELISELGAPFNLFWRRLCNKMPELKAARILAGVLGMIVEHGEPLVREALERMIEGGQLDLLTLGAALRKNESPVLPAVPESLRHYQIEAAKAQDYDHLMQGGRPWV